MERAKRRGPFNIVGCMIFLVLYHVLPESMYPYIGMIGGIGVGYSAGYAWQTVFNTFGALSIASGLFGAGTAVALRIIFNVMGSVYTVVCDRFLDFLRKRTEIHRWVRWHKISRSPGSAHSLCRDKACGRLPE